MFIELTFGNGTKGMFNTKQITIVEVASDNETRVTLQNDNYYFVQETYDEVKALLRGTNKTEPIVADGITYQVPVLTETEILQQYNAWRKQGYSHVASISVMINTLKIDPRLLNELTKGHRD